MPTIIINDSYFIDPEPPIPLCADCAAQIGGACAGPDARWRPADRGEDCAADDCVNRDVIDAPFPCEDWTR